MDMDNRVVIAVGRGYRGLKGNVKNTIKIKIKNITKQYSTRLNCVFIYVCLPVRTNTMSTD